MIALLRSLFPLILCCALSCSSLARAQADERASSARALFEQGLAAADGARWSEAAELFERALSLRDSPVIRFNLASALAELGQLVEALDLLRALEEDARTNPELRARIDHDRTGVERRIAHLKIHVDGEVGEWQLRLDDRTLAREQVGSEIAVDPKLHYVSLREGDRVLDDKQVELGEGELREIRLSARVPAPVVVAEPPAKLSLKLAAPTPRQDEAPSPGKRKRRLIWGLSSAAVAVAAGVVAGVLVARKDDGSGAPDAFSPGRIGVRVPE
jgi:tetratricopeptide (TPR) repeat protein